MYELVVLKNFKTEELFDLPGRVRVIEEVVSDEDGGLDVSHLQARRVTKRRRYRQRRDGTRRRGEKRRTQS